MIMSLQTILKKRGAVLAEAAICERLRRVDGIDLHPSLFNAPLIYDAKASAVMCDIYLEYIDIARQFSLPVLIDAPTWRLDAERVAAAEVPRSINRDAVDFIREVQKRSGYNQVYVGGLVGPKNDCYDPNSALSPGDGALFHQQQAQELAEAGVDYLLAQTMPAVSEAEGVARAMLSTGVPSIVSFCINQQGSVLDGVPLGEAIERLDTQLKGLDGQGDKLLGFQVNCSHPDFISEGSMSPKNWRRLIGIKANASALSHAELERASSTIEDDIERWLAAMVSLNRKYGVKILGGCCGTHGRHLQAIAESLAQIVK